MTCKPIYWGQTTNIFENVEQFNSKMSFCGHHYVSECRRMNNVLSPETFFLKKFYTKMIVFEALSTLA